MLHVLIADDELAARAGLKRALAKLECTISEAKSGVEALAAIHSDTLQTPDLVFLDLTMPEMTGEEVLSKLQVRPLEAEVVVVTADDSLDSAIRCMQLGATDYITKPFELERVRAIVRRNLERCELRERVASLSGELEVQRAGRQGFGDLIGSSQVMKDLFRVMERAAKAPLPVLIRGETGTGKDLIAQEIHRHSSRSKGPFVAANVAAISESLAESELFGHTKGAFTGAHSDRLGYFREADGGTLFLDEIGDMPRALQSKILRTLQEGEVRPVGASKPVSVDVRIVCATHQDLEEGIKHGDFREDLYYRLFGVSIEVPPLRARQQDILMLAEHFLDHYAEQMGVGGDSESNRPTIAPDAAARLLRHAWPGNVRELKALVQSAAALCPGPLIREVDLGLEVKSPVEDLVDVDVLGDLPLTEAKQQLISWFEERAISRALLAADGNISETARKLGMHRQSLQKKMDQLGMHRPRSY